MKRQPPQETMIVCELCGRNTLHRITKGDFDDDPLSKICTKCGLWTDHKIKEEDKFDRYQDDF